MTARNCAMEVIMKKRLFTAALIILVAALTLGCFTACYGDADYFANLAEYGSCATSSSTKSIWAVATTATPKSEPTARANRQCAGANFRARVCYMKKRARRIQRRRFEALIIGLPKILIKCQRQSPVQADKPTTTVARNRASRAT